MQGKWFQQLNWLYLNEPAREAEQKGDYLAKLNHLGNTRIHIVKIKSNNTKLSPAVWTCQSHKSWPPVPVLTLDFCICVISRSCLHSLICWFFCDCQICFLYLSVKRLHSRERQLSSSRKTSNLVCSFDNSCCRSPCRESLVDILSDKVNKTPATTKTKTSMTVKTTWSESICWSWHISLVVFSYLIQVVLLSLSSAVAVLAPKVFVLLNSRWDCL